MRIGTCSDTGSCGTMVLVVPDTHDTGNPSHDYVTVGCVPTTNRKYRVMMRAIQVGSYE